METNNDGLTKLNLEILYYIYAGKLLEKSNLYNPKDLEIDLINLKEQGFIEYSGKTDAVTITDKGINALDIVFALANSNVPEEIEEQFFKDNKIDSLQEDL